MPAKRKQRCTICLNNVRVNRYKRHMSKCTGSTQAPCSSTLPSIIRKLLRDSRCLALQRLLQYVLNKPIDLERLLTSLKYTTECIAAVYEALEIPGVRDSSSDQASAIPAHVTEVLAQVPRRLQHKHYKQEVSLAHIFSSTLGQSCLLEPRSAEAGRPNRLKPWWLIDVGGSHGPTNSNPIYYSTLHICPVVM